MPVRLLSGGAAQGLIGALAARFKRETGADIIASFGAVGAMRDRLLAGEPVDLLILTSQMLRELARQGKVVAATIGDLGRVETALAVKTADPPPPVGTAEQLRTALRDADAIYFPDPVRATAGIHFAKVLEAVGLSAARLTAQARPHADGATAMRALAASSARRAIGATQATEILNTPGVRLVAPLPPPFGLATVYSAGVSATAARPGEARALSALLTAADTLNLRASIGFQALA
jgi:molybdate transport system substrate-binding protein